MFQEKSTSACAPLGGPEGTRDTAQMSTVAKGQWRSTQGTWGLPLHVSTHPLEVSAVSQK